MKEDIDFPKVEGVSVAIIKEEEDVWEAYLINQNNYPLEGVLVNSRGYGEIKGREKKTSSLRHFFDVVPAQSYIKVEPIQNELLALSNEYWVSFYNNKKMYDKKYIFLPETIIKSNTVDIPLIGKKGILIN